MHLALLLTVLGIGVWAHRPSSHSHGSHSVEFASHESQSHGHDKCNLCVDIKKKNPHAKDKVYSLRVWDPIAKRQRKVKAFCDMTNGGYTLFQRRVNNNVSFAVDWEPYMHGFGDKAGSYWLGNNNIHLITSYCGCQALRIGLEAGNGYKGEIIYKKFQIGDESSGFVAAVSGALNRTHKSYDPLNTKVPKQTMDGTRFSTHGVDHDKWHAQCSRSYGRSHEHSKIASFFRGVDDK